MPGTQISVYVSDNDWNLYKKNQEDLHSKTRDYFFKLLKGIKK